MSPTRMFKGETAEQRRNDRRGRLREACLDLIGAGGLSAATVNAVCAEAGLTKRYFYESYPDRDALLVELLSDLLDGVRYDIIETLAHVEADVEARSLATLEIVLGGLEADRRRARLYVECPGEPVLLARRDRAIEEFAELLGTVVGLDPKAPDERFALFVVVAGVTEIISRWLNGHGTWTREELARATARLGRAVERF
jgi:AcrR family transcriptional regulator